MYLKHFSFMAMLLSSICISSNVLSDSNKPADPNKSKKDVKFLIEPGVGMGKLHFGMTREEMIKILGQPHGINMPNINDYTEFGLTVVIRNGVVSSITCGLDPSTIKKCKCVTTKGIKMGSTKQQIIAAYGEPFMVADENGLTVLRYKNILMSFSLRDDKVVAMNAMMQMTKEQIKATKACLRILDNAITQFKADTGRYPTEEEGLQALIMQPVGVKNYRAGGYLETKQIAKDAWGNDFIYHLKPASGKPFEVISLGADKEFGGEGVNADLRSVDPE